MEFWHLGGQALSFGGRRCQGAFRFDAPSAGLTPALLMQAWLERCTDKFDVMILDLSDPIEAGPGWTLYTKEFYQVGFVV
jgi:hypothetical protein